MATLGSGGDLRIDFESLDFPAGLVSGSYIVHTSWEEILWSAITIGRPNVAYVFRHGDASYHEALFRLSLIRTAIEQRRFLGGRLFRTEAFQALDPTEKGAVSYFLGMTLCKLFATRCLGTPWLLHLDVFRGDLDPEVLRGRSRPDLVGQDNNGNWHAFESKGRSSTPSRDDMAKAKAQAQRLVSVNGTPCQLHVGAISYFRYDWLHFYWRDPEPEKLSSIDVELPEGAWRYYYEPAAFFFRERETGREQTLTEALDVTVDAHPELKELLLERQWDRAQRMATELQDDFRENGYQPDGLRLECGQSWSSPFKG